MNSTDDKVISFVPASSKGKQIKVFTTSEQVKERLQGLRTNQEILYVKKRENSDLVIYEDRKASKRSDGQADLLGVLFQTKGRNSAQVSFLSEEHIAAYIHMVWNLLCNPEKNLIGGKEEIMTATEGTMFEYIRQDVAKTAEENELSIFTEKLMGAECKGRGLIFGHMASLLRLNSFAMEIEAKYPNMLFFLCACMPGKEEDEYMEALLFN
ncbi:MAG: hypothetical protein Q4F05_07720 [bacterium]|nr:hypothetical protein [bacterium]